ncbi:MAG: hypothetical protein Ta2F_03150 [Termitinemataceae bacterium]|nr:MAG: hypothetical protein Ta2F_03150 [Termitinemataceae bacterium]
MKRTTKLKSLFKFLIIAIISLLLSLCSSNAPTLAYSFMQIVYTESEDSTFVQHITFFVLANDEDGVDDIAELRLYNDFEGLLWKITPDRWTLLTEDSNTWIGSRDFAMPSGEPIPSGQYRAVLIDKGGDQTARTFGFDGAAQSRFPFPKFTVTEGNYVIESQYPDNSFVCYGPSGEFKSIIPVPKKTGTIAELNLGADVVSVGLWANDPANSVSATTKLNPLHTSP